MLRDSEVPTITPAASADFQVSHATRDDWRVVERWIEDQQWDPGVSDADQFFTVDPSGYFVGRLAGEIVSSIAVVNYDDQYAFLGQYLVRPEYRGQGLGLATWRAAIGHAGPRTIALESGDEHLTKYRNAGFRDAYRTEHYAGRVRSGGPAAGVLPASEWDPAEIAALDSRVFPADRTSFILSWLTAPGHTAVVRVLDYQLRGYGVIREAPSGYRVGPLVAERPEDAEAIFDALTADVGGAEVSLEVPMPNAAGGDLAKAAGLQPIYQTTRMHTRPIRSTELDLSNAIASFELG
jgi:GNAT superfamily N-acetyltransferase